MSRSALGGLLLGIASLAGVVPAAAQSSPAEARAVERAQRMRENGRPDDAMRALIAFLQDAPAATGALAALETLSTEAGEASAFLRIAERAARASSEPRVRALHVRALLAAGEGDSALAVARSWFGSEPGSADAALALAGAEAARGDTVMALSTLRTAAERTQDGRIPARVADLHLAARQDAETVAAWRRMLEREPPDLEGVLDDLARARGRQGGLLDALADALDEAAAPVRSAAARVALRAGEGGPARRLAEGAAETGRSEATPGADREGEGREAFLRDYVLEAERAGLSAEVAWGAMELARLSPRPIERLRWRAIAAERSLAAADTGAARRQLATLSRESGAGQPPHEAATRRLFELVVSDPARRAEAADVLDRYESAYPDSVAARAEMRAEIVLALARSGEVASAGALLARFRAGIDPALQGPLDAAAGWIALVTGDRDSAVARLGRSLSDPRLGPQARTDRLALLGVLETADSSEVAVLAAFERGLAESPADFDPSSSLGELERAPASPGRPGVLVRLANAAERAGREELAARLRTRVIEKHADSPEAPVALLALARGAASQAEARTWLERLIVGYPESALAPVARRLLAELSGGGEGE